MNKENKTAKTKIDAAEAQVIRSRKLKYGTMATLFTLLFIVAVIVINVFVGYLTDRFVLEFDMTSDSLYDISEDTREVLADLTEPITITVLAEETTYKDSTELLSRIYEVLQRYEALAGGMLTVEYINPDVNPLLMQKYDTLGGISRNDIIIESAKRFKHLTPSNLYEYQSDDSGNTYIVGLRAEQRLTSGILFTLQEKIPLALFTTGHGETTNLSELEGLLTSGNYEVGTVNLATEEIPEDAGIIIISSPTADFTEDELDSFDAFMAGGGDAIVSMSSAQTESLTRLERYFEEWGVKYGKDMVFDTTQSLSGYPMYIVPALSALEGLTDAITTRSSYVTIPGARSISTLFEESSWRTTYPLMATSSASYAKSTLNAVTSLDREDGDVGGPFNVAVLAAETHVDNLDYSYSYILFCNTGMIADSVLEIDNLMNSQYMVATINFMSDDKDAVLIEAKNFSSTTLSILGSQVSVLFWVLIVIIPFGLLALGLVIWLRRRHL